MRPLKLRKINLAILSIYAGVLYFIFAAFDSKIISPKDPFDLTVVVIVVLLGLIVVGSSFYSLGSNPSEEEIDADERPHHEIPLSPSLNIPEEELSPTLKLEIAGILHNDQFS